MSFCIQGKYNKAKVFAATVDDTTYAQILEITNNPTFEGMNIAIQADCHAGKGAVIGFTASMNDKIVPNLIGVDIGCGVVAYPLNEPRGYFTDDVLRRFDQNLKRTIPSGFYGHKDDRALKLLPGYAVNALKIMPLVTHAGIPYNQFMEKVGTLGGGNHFIELDADAQGKVWLVVHSGSRNYGNQIAVWHQKKAAEKNPGVRGQEFLTGGDRSDYLDDMRLAQRYAVYSRELMVRLILSSMETSGILGHTGYDRENMISSVHNYIDIDDGGDQLIRKGAIQANRGQKVVIPMNMAFGTVLGTGLGSENHNHSAPHGAGRTMSRSQAKKQITLEAFRASMASVWSSTVTPSTLDEAPAAYKDPRDILYALGSTVAVDEILKPIYNYKDSAEKG